MDEGMRWVAPSARLLTVRRVQLSLVAGPLALAGGLLAGVLVAPWIGVLLGGLVRVGALAAEQVLRRRVGSWASAERDDDFLVRRGVLFSRLSVVPYGRMQFVDVTAGPFERAYGLATVKMHTAAAASDARI